MTDSLTIALVAATPPTLVAIAALIVAIRGQKKTQQEVAQIHIAVNSRMDALLALTEKSAHAEGVKDELARDK